MSNVSVDNVVNFINSDISEDNIKLVMTFMLILSILALVFFLVENDVITSKFIIFIIVISIFIYTYTNRKYSNRINNLKKQIDINSLSNILTEMCNGNTENEICKKFVENKNNYSQILKGIVK